MDAEVHDRARPVSLLLVIGAVAGALAGGYLVQTPHVREIGRYRPGCQLARATDRIVPVGVALGDTIERWTRTPLGRSTLTVSRVGLGCNNFGRRIDREASLEVLAAAVDAGITFFDTADVYGSGASERIVGEALAGRSDDLVVATKFGMDMEGANGDAPGGSREYVRRAIDASLERLGRDHVDLYYYHRPDGVTPLDETLGAMHELVVEGKVRWLGLSNVEPAHLEQAAAFAAAGNSPVVAVQNYFSLLHRDDEADVLPLARELGMGYIPYFPLESGLLTGKYRRGEPEPEGARLSGAERRPAQ